MSAATLAAAVAAAAPLLVTPGQLADAGAAAEPWLSPAAGVLLSEALSARGAAVVDPADVRLAAERLGLPGGAPGRAAALRLVEALGARAALVPTASLRGTTLTLSVRRLEPDALGSPVAVSGPLASLAGVVSALAGRLAGDGTPGSGVDVPEAAVSDWARGLGGESLEARRAALSRAVAAAPGHDGPRLALAEVLLELDEPEAAAEALAAVRDPARARRAALLRGRALLEAGRPGAAAEVFAALAAERETPAALNGVGVALLRRDAPAVPAGALESLARAAELAPESPDVAFNLAWAELRAGRAAAAAGRLEALARREPRDAVARLVRMWALSETGDEATREAEWEALVSLAPGLASLAEPDLARPLERLLGSEHPFAAGGDPRRAAERAADAIGRAERLLSAGALENAWREASRAVYLDPHRARAHLVLARTLRARGEDEAALRALEVALWAREDPAVRRELVLYLEELGRAESARAEAEALLAADPEDPVGRRLLGAAHRRP